MEKKNYMNEIAKMFGVEMGEEFTIVERGLEYERFYFSENGLERVGYSLWYDGTLCGLLCGRLSLVKSPWLPQYAERYYFVTPEGNIEEDVNEDSYIDKLLFTVRNFYKTKEEITPFEIEKWVDWYVESSK